MKPAREKVVVCPTQSVIQKGRQADEQKSRRQVHSQRIFQCRANPCRRRAGRGQSQPAGEGRVCPRAAGAQLSGRAGAPDCDCLLCVVLAQSLALDLRSEEHTSELHEPTCTARRRVREKKKEIIKNIYNNFGL